MPAADRRRILITGGHGMIGRAMEGGIKPTSAECDVRNPSQIAECIGRVRPESIVHLAALNLQSSERDPLLAMAVNTEGTHNMARAARDAGIPFVFLSTGAVFGGARGDTFDEDGVPCPANVYGHSKYRAELLVREVLPDALIVRTGWVFGGSQAHHRKFVDSVIELARGDKPIRAADDRWGSPTYVADLVTELWRLIDDKRHGVVHVVNAGTATAYDMACEIVAAMKSASIVEAVAQAEISPVPPRAVSETLCSKYVSLRPWQEALREYALRYLA